MYTFPQQQKIFKELLNNNPSNKQCADCNTIGPTWASLNFGVFLCSNCSGAHRALGPTITRVKSTKLDQWQKQWMECMQIGNKQVNEFWQASLGMTKKPRMGASQQQLMKYASEKYVKKRFVKNQSQQDPLTQYKNGTYVRATAKQDTKSQQNKKVTQAPVPLVIKKSVDVCSNVAVQNETRNLNLLQFQFPQQPKHEVQSQSGGNDIKRIATDFPQNVYETNGQDQIREKSENMGVISKSDDDDEFSEYTEHGTSFTATTNDANLTYEELLAKRNQQVNHVRYNVPPVLHHTHSASSIPHYTSPPFNVNLNGHQHHIGGHQGGYVNNVNIKQIYPQNSNPYQSVGFIPGPNQPFNPQQQYNSLYGNQNNQFIHQNSIGIGQNYVYPQSPTSPYLPNNNLTLNTNLMSNPNQQNLNPHAQTLGGYHNQGIGSHSGQSLSNQPQKQQEFKWNDFSGWEGMGKHHQTHQVNQPQPAPQQNQTDPQQKSWIDDWK